MACEVPMLLARHVPLIPGATTVTGGIASGWEVAQGVGAVIGAVITVIGLALAIAGNNAKRRREYEQEIRAAEARGEKRVHDEMDRDLDRAERDADFWRSYALANRSETTPIPIPPSQRRSDEEER